MYHMRINGDILDHDLLASFDGQLRASVSTSLAGDLPDHSWWQATTGVAVGGLGLRTAVTVALPAFVASRILSRSLVATMVDHFCAAIGASRQTIMAEYDARTDEALSRLASTLPTVTALDLLAKLDEAYAECHLSWQNVLSGSEPAMQDQPLSAPRHARGITPDERLMVMMSTRTRGSEPRSKALSLRALTLESARVCCRCTKVKGLGLLACVLQSLATPL